MKRLRARFPVVCGCLLAFGSIGAFAQSVDDPGFRSEYLRLYQALKGVAQNVIVMEMRERVELIAGRGSHVGAASNERRIDGFTRALLEGLQDATCRSGQQSPARPSPIVAAKISAAATAQHLRTNAKDVAQLTALTQRLLDGEPHERWCGLKSLDDIP
jgi:hypothetical protein